MQLLIIIVLSLVQGITEFLPISSSGHLVVLYNFFYITNNVILLSVFLHLATLLSILVYYRKNILKLVKNPFCKTNKLLVTATIPTIIIVLIFESIITESFSGRFIIICFLITAILLVLAQIIYEKKYNCQNGMCSKSKSVEFLTESDITNFNINYKQAIAIGTFQGIAGLPGISRSGSTIAGGLMVGVDKTQVADFSFLLSIPIIFASMIYELYKLKDFGGVIDFNFWQLFIGFVIAFIVGLICLRYMIKIVKKQKLWIFSIYLVLLSIALFVYGLVV